MKLIDITIRLSVKDDTKNALMKVLEDDIRAAVKKHTGQEGPDVELEYEVYDEDGAEANLD